MRKFLVIIFVLAIVFVAGCSVAQAQNIKTKNSDNPNKEKTSNLKQEELNSKLIEAIDEQNLEKVKNLLTAGADVNTRANDYNQSPALIYAVNKKNINIIKLLIEAGADVNAKDKFNSPALIHAVDKKENADIVQLLINAGAKVNIKGWMYDDIPIIIASKKGYFDIVNILLKAGAKDSLHIAAARGDADVVKSFIENGADVNAEGKFGAPALIYAIENGHTEIVKLLLAAGANIKGEQYQTSPLMLAVEKGYTEITDILLEAGVNVNAYRWCDSVLTIAIRQCRLDIVKKLIKAYVDVDATIGCGEADEGFVSEGEYITPLNLAISETAENPVCEDVVEELLKAGVEQSTKDDELISAMLNNNTAIIELLQKYGAKDTLSTAIIRNDLELFKKLLKTADSKDKNRALTLAIEKDNIPMLKELINDGVELNTFKEYSSETILSSAVIHGNAEIVKILLEAGANPDYICNHEGDYVYDDECPLLMASEFEYLEIVKELLKAKADPDAGTRHNGAPLRVAIQKGNIDIVKELLKAGADVNIKDWNGKTALMLAQENGNKEILELLKDAGAKE